MWLQPHIYFQSIFLYNLYNIPNFFYKISTIQSHVIYSYASDSNGTEFKKQTTLWYIGARDMFVFKYTVF